MNLPFSQELNDKPTYFPEKILAGLNSYNIISAMEASSCFVYKALVEYFELKKAA